LYLAAAFEGNNLFHVQIVDLQSGNMRNKTPEELFGNDDANIFGITSSTYSRFQAIDLAKVLKRLHPDSWIVVGGVHFSHCAEETLAYVPEIDVVVRGEGEITFTQLADRIAHGQSLDPVQGITYRAGSLVIHNPDQQTAVDLDRINPYSCYSWDDYPEYLFGYPERVKAASVMSSRGCPNSCIFCAKRATSYRVRRADLVCDEIEMLLDRLSLRAINFIDLSFTVWPAHVSEMCRTMSDRDLGVMWWCESRANVPLKLLELMRKAGCVSVAVGVESGSPPVLSRLRKNITLDQVRQFCKTCKQLDIHVQCYFMYSHPGETDREVLETLDFMVELDQWAQCYIQPAMIFPGTELESIARGKSVLLEGFNWCNLYDSHFNVALRQLSTCPLYIEKLSPQFMKIVPRLLQKKRFTAGREQYLREDVMDSNLITLLQKAYSHFFVQRKPLPDFVCWPFLKMLFKRKVGFRTGPSS